MKENICRSCGAPLKIVFCDLGLTPISNAFIRPEECSRGEMFYPLQVQVCECCWLVQLKDSPGAEVHFNADYAYFSSVSTSWLAHAKQYVEMMTQRFELSSSSKVMEIASNDGYLLQYFVKAGITCLGIEPTANTALAARAKGVMCREAFFGLSTARSLAEEGWKVDLLLGNNVLAHVPDINDFISGVPQVIKEQAVVTFEFPHLLKLIQQNQFDTIYHEHYSYLSLTALMPIFFRFGLRVFDVERLQTHGGSLRVFLCKQQANHLETAAVQSVLSEEAYFGSAKVETYTAFAEKVNATKRNLLSFVIQAKEKRQQIVAYGAAAKGNTLLNYCGIGTDFIDYVADQSEAKQGKLLPGTRIPVVSPSMINQTKPDIVIVLPWNIKTEIMDQLSGIKEWGGKFVIPIPCIEVVE